MARKAVMETIREIEICKRDRVAIRGSSHCDDVRSSYTSRETFIQGINELCPNCFAAEPWMPAQCSAKQLEDLKEENFPAIFTTDAEAREWALAQVAERVRQVRLLRQSPETEEAAQALVQTLKTEIEALEAQRSESGLLEKKAAYEQELAGLERHKYDIGILDLKGWRAHKEAVNRTKYYLRKLEEEILEEFKPINARITALRVELQEQLLLANGCTDAVLVCRVGNSRSFHPGIAVERDLAQAFHSTWYDDAVEEKTGVEYWKVGEAPKKPGCHLTLPETAFRDMDDAEWVLLIIASVAFPIAYVYEVIRLFTKGVEISFLWGFVLMVAMATVDYLIFAKTNENRKKYAGMFFLILLSSMLLVVSITGMVFAAQSGSQLQQVLFAAITAVILIAAVLIGLILRGVKLTKLRLFTKEK